jgi:nucleoid DNA-binding protein
MYHDYEFVYKTQKRRYPFEPLTDCSTTKETINQFCKRTGISKKDATIFFQYLREFLGDAVECNAKIVISGIFDLRYRVQKPRKLKDINGEWTDYPAIVKPYLYLPRRLKERGRLTMSNEEYETYFSKNKDSNDEEE